jgi:hypothetical protein
MPSWILTACAPLLIAPAAFCQSGPAAARPFTCPASVNVTESAAAPPPWNAESSGPAEHRFLRPSIFNGAPGKQEYELAPDSQNAPGQVVKQTWRLSDYRDNNLCVRCRYEGTAVTLTSDLPARLKICSFSFRNPPGDHPITSPVFGCR